MGIRIRICIKSYGSGMLHRKLEKSSLAELELIISLIENIK
jgi:hypothetical protein